MYVTFPVSARQLLEIRKNAEAHGRNPRAVTVKLRLPDGSIYGETGKINFVDVQVEPTTDTVIVRATIPNPKRLLMDNQRSEEHTSELQSLMRISYAVYCLKK